MHRIDPSVDAVTPMAGHIEYPSVSSTFGISMARSSDRDIGTPIRRGDHQWNFRIDHTEQITAKADQLRAHRNNLLAN